MKAQEWLDWHDYFIFHPKSDPYFVNKVCIAADIIRSQQERIERLTAKIAELKAASDLYEAAETGEEYGNAYDKEVAAVNALFAELEEK